MTIWRPKKSIRVKALGLIWRDGYLLASEIYQDDGTIKGVRPLGGTVEFGETWQQALIREFQEELGYQIEVVGDPLVLENIYTHYGEIGHEVVFVSDIKLPAAFYTQKGPIEFFEDNGHKCVARWFDLSTLGLGGLELYPAGLKDALQGRSL